MQVGKSKEKKTFGITRAHLEEDAGGSLLCLILSSIAAMPSSHRKSDAIVGIMLLWPTSLSMHSAVHHCDRSVRELLAQRSRLGHSGAHSHRVSHCRIAAVLWLQCRSLRLYTGTH